MNICERDLLGEQEMRYFKVFTEDEVLLLQARAREDVYAWMLRDFDLPSSQYATALIDLEEYQSALEGGLNLIAVPVGLGQSQRRLRHKILPWLSRRSGKQNALQIFASLFIS